jgi:hypothetical protein
VRTLGRLLIGLIRLGLLLGFMLRGRWPRQRLRWLLAACFLPALVHAGLAAAGALDDGVDAGWVVLFLVATLASAAGGWHFAARLAPFRPFSAALVVPGQAMFQGLATGALERAVIALGASVNPVATAAFVGVAVMLGTALAVVLPTRAHFPGLPRAPAWWVALMRTLGRR